jgi:hypothetical protein
MSCVDPRPQDRAAAGDERELAAPSDLIAHAGVTSEARAPTEPARVAALLTAAVRLYASSVEDGRGDELARALESEHDLQATEVLHAVSALMRAADLETFELTMWKAWART